LARMNPIPIPIIKAKKTRKAIALDR